MIGQLGPPVPGHRGHDTLRKLLQPGNQGADNAVAVLAANLDQHDIARAAFDECGHVAVSGATQQIAFPMAGADTILAVGGPVADRYGIDDLSRVCLAVEVVPPRRLIPRLRR
jgi:hypothetical protein